MIAGGAPEGTIRVEVQQLVVALSTIVVRRESDQPGNRQTWIDPN